MLQLSIKGKELWDPVKEEFITLKDQTIVLEHSLVSISKWESKWHKSFIEHGLETVDQIKDYVKCMTITQNVPDNVYDLIVSDVTYLKKILDYINDPMTATWFSEEKEPKKSGKKEVITSELLYYYMTAFNIPSEYQKWHLNRLLTLIRICVIKNEPSKNMSKNNVYSQNKALNAARRSRLRSRG